MRTTGLETRDHSVGGMLAPNTTNEEKSEAASDATVKSRARDAGKTARVRGLLDTFLQDHQSFRESAVKLEWEVSVAKLP